MKRESYKEYATKIGERVVKRDGMQHFMIVYVALVTL